MGRKRSKPNPPTQNDGGNEATVSSQPATTNKSLQPDSTQSSSDESTLQKVSCKVVLLTENLVVYPRSLDSVIYQNRNLDMKTAGSEYIISSKSMSLVFSS